VLFMPNNCSAWFLFLLFTYILCILYGQQWHEGCQKEVEISFIRADDNGSFERQGGTYMLFHGRSLTELGNEIATRMGSGVTVEDMTLFVLGGRLAQPTPLLTDLPFRDDPLTIVVFIDGTPGKQRVQSLHFFPLLYDVGRYAIFVKKKDLESRPNIIFLHLLVVVDNTCDLISSVVK
jgi:hypothetical protein